MELLKRLINFQHRATWSRHILTICTVTIAWLPVSGCATIAKQNMQISRDRVPAQSRLKYELALQHFHAGRTDTALQTIHEAIRANPNSTAQYLLKAQCHIELGQLISAKLAAEKAKACDPESAEADYTLGVIAERKGDVEEALEHHRRARMRGRGAVDYVVAEAECLMAMGRSSQAMELISTQIDHFDSDGTLEMLLGQIHLLNEDSDAAIRELGNAYQKSDCSSQRLQGTAGCAMLIEEYTTLLVKEKQYEQAIALLHPFIEAHDSAPPSAVANLGTCYVATGQSIAAMHLLTAQTIRHPNSATCWLVFAKAAISVGDWTTARESVDTLVRLVPDSSMVHLIRGYVCWKQNDPVEAVKSLTQSLAIEPNVTAVHCLIAQILEDSDQNAVRVLAHYNRTSQIESLNVCNKHIVGHNTNYELAKTTPNKFQDSPTIEARLP